MKSGEASAQWWAAAAGAVEERAAGALADKGHPNAQDAPAVMRQAALAWARAEVLAESCWWRVAESGGPLASSGKVRAAFKAWQSADARCESWARLLGLQRVPKNINPLDAVRAAVERANR
jgi:hypothetical protein